MTDENGTAIGFIGLGAMGAGMVDNLLKAGLAVTGFDVRAEALERLREKGGCPAASPAEAADGAGLLILMVVNDAQVEAVLFGEGGALETLAPGAVVMMCSTVPATFTRKLGARLAERGIELLDAPVSGGAIGADLGRLTFMASGSDKAFAASEHAMEIMAARVFKLGDQVGTGSSVKAVNQLLAGVNLVTAAEGMAFGVAQGADPELLFEIIKDAAGGSWMFADRVPHMLEDDYTPKSAVSIWAKDLGLVLDQAKSMDMPVPVTAAAYQVVMMAMAKGLAGIDDAGFVKVYEDFTGARIAARGSDAA
ncbi:MAG: NAD(P)-binding domain-containing protein [Alphaproteobacteria bacterium]